MAALGGQVAAGRLGDGRCLSTSAPAASNSPVCIWQADPLASAMGSTASARVAIRAVDNRAESLVLPLSSTDVARVQRQCPAYLVFRGRTSPRRKWWLTARLRAGAPRRVSSVIIRAALPERSAAVAAARGRAGPPRAGRSQAARPIRPCGRRTSPRPSRPDRSPRASPRSPARTSLAVARSRLDASAL